MENPVDDAGRPAETAETAGREGATGSRLGSARSILRARPVAGMVDHAALTRQIIARFPKILSELAK
jgi:hypothetical protein